MTAYTETFDPTAQPSADVASMTEAEACTVLLGPPDIMHTLRVTTSHQTDHCLIAYWQNGEQIHGGVALTRDMATAVDMFFEWIRGCACEPCTLRRALAPLRYDLDRMIDSRTRAQ